MQIVLKPTLNGLELQSKVISIESLSRHLPNKPLLSKLSGLTNDVAEFISEKTSALFARASSPRIGLSGSPASALKSVPYLELKDVMMPCPEGLKISFLEYANLLVDSQKVTSYLMEDCLYPFSAFISEALNNPEKMSSSVRTSGVKLHNLDQLRKRLSSAFDGVDGAMPYIKVVARHSDWDELEKTLGKVLATSAKTNDKLIAEKIVDIQNNLNKLIDRMQDTNERYRPSTELISELSKLAYGLAEQVTFYSIISTSIESLVVAVEQGKEVIKAAAKAAKK